MLIDARFVLEEQDINRDLPKNFSEKDEKYFKPAINSKAKETEIKTFKNITLNNELFIKEGFKFKISIESFGGKWQDKVFNRPSYQTKNFIKNFLRRKREIKEALWCFDQFSTGGYYHWVTEICPRLWVAKQYTDPKLPLLVPQYFLDKWSFAESFFKAFNREIITFKENEVIHVENLTFIGQTGGVMNCQPVSIHASTTLLKNHYLKNEKITNEKVERIYISRNKSGKRTILNENEIIPILEEYGFRIIHSEEYTLEEQIQLFSNATHLLSIHGAGLTNMVFMPPNSKIIEIRHEEVNPMLNFFYALAHTFDMNYYYVFGNNKGDTLPNENRPEDKSLHVNVEMLHSVLRSL